MAGSCFGGGGEGCPEHPCAASPPSCSHHCHLPQGFAAPRSEVDNARGGVNGLQLHGGGGVQLTPPRGPSTPPSRHWDRRIPKPQPEHCAPLLRPCNSAAFMFISHKYSSLLGQRGWKWLLEPIHTSFVVS